MLDIVPNTLFYLGLKNIEYLLLLIVPTSVWRLNFKNDDILNVFEFFVCLFGFFFLIFLSKFFYLCHHSFRRLGPETIQPVPSSNHVVFSIYFSHNLSELTFSFPIPLLTVIALELRAAFGLLVDDHASVRWWVRHFRTHSQMAHQITGCARAPQARLVCVDRRARFVAPSLVAASGRRDVWRE